jgi:hypothetical protein
VLSPPDRTICMISGQHQEGATSTCDSSTALARSKPVTSLTQRRCPSFCGVARLLSAAGGGASGLAGS